jgi:hypothetical protein
VRRTIRCRCGSGSSVLPTVAMRPTDTPTSDAGQLSWILGTPPIGDKPFKRLDKTTVRNAIKTAVAHGWLADGSCSECLVVPGHAIAGGMGNEFKPCSVHERKNAQKRSKLARLTLVS